MAKKPYDDIIPEVRELADSITTKQLSHVRDLALKDWLANPAKDTDLVARAWFNATLIILNANGYEIKKKV